MERRNRNEEQSLLSTERDGGGRIEHDRQVRKYWQGLDSYLSINFSFFASLYPATRTMA